MLTGKVYYSLASGEIGFGKLRGKPVPQIILGDISVKPNHANIKILPTGLFELRVPDVEAGQVTLVNGKQIRRKKKVLGHLDRLAFPGGIIFVFKFPHLKRAMDL